ncbi:hypothetical protein [Saccharothrix australiensis]|uniref:Uncharacterized protein n=1 Tax=Saccharothrix australiensis TaxID=2072 RepID=A0A495VYN2_9PSEU|nr:hypothetical protein [Saccharothrix australiensis]RKT54436.1 hypothetical protein C8E97_3058 [Saccharothrix australiensis]
MTARHGLLRVRAAESPFPSHDDERYRDGWVHTRVRADVDGGVVRTRP